MNLLADTSSSIRQNSAKNNMNKKDEKDEDDENEANNGNQLCRQTSSNLNNEEDNEYKDNILTNIEELISELESIGEVINEQANDHINDNDVILTANHSDQLKDFFIVASQDKKFHVIIAESAPSLK